MKKNILYIFSFTLAALLCLSSCALEESTDTLQNSDGYIEFVAKPTSYVNHNVETKGLGSSDITDLENNIYTAFFMIFDNNGDRVIFEDLTNSINQNVIPSQSIMTDKGLSNAVVCFFANISYAQAAAMQSIQQLSIALDYADITSGCLGIPRLVDRDKDIDVYSIPMAGFLQSDLSKSIEGALQIPLERLMSKVIVNLSVDMQNVQTQKKPQFTLSNFIINNMPTKVSPAKVNEGEQTAWAASRSESDFLNSNNVLTYFNLDDGEDDSNVVMQGQGTKSLYFYVPEHVVIPDLENNRPADVRQRYKPTLFNTDSPKRPLYVSIIGDVIDENGNSGIAQYDIYLGLNEYDNFSVFRNYIYTNNIVIKGTQEVDHRVSISQGDISVSFKRATYLDSHYEVRPLRISWANNELGANGTVKIKILDAYDNQATPPTWIRLERPSNRQNNVYCGSLGKRKYFTTDLITTTLANNKEVSYEISADATGTYPTWVYVDEYLVTSKSSLDITGKFETFSDAIRQARISIEYFPEGESQPKDVVEYIVTQRSVYPVVATNQEIDLIDFIGVSSRQKYTYGIEYFEEYLYDYDDIDIDETEGDGYSYAETQNGMKWGLNNVQLSSSTKSVTISEVSIADEGFFSTIANKLSTIKAIIRAIVTETIDVDGMPYYDFYLKRENSNLGKEYNGAAYNKQILKTLASLDASSDDIDLKLTLADTPKSIIEYCYNKNKRNSDGTISTIHWYVPSIDEIEDIALSAYNTFDVFQNELYWSCQPAYNHNTASLNDYYFKLGIGESTTYIDGRTPNIEYTETITSSSTFVGTGEYYTDNVSRARATKIDSNGKNVSSSVSGTANTMNISGTYKYYYLYYEHKQQKTFGRYWILKDSISENPREVNDHSVIVTPNTSISYDDHPGNQTRTSAHRVRCVYSKDGFSL